MKRLTSALILVLGCAHAPSAAPPAEPPAEPYGSSPATAIEVCRPQGQRAYLRRLRCPDGNAPEFKRGGSGQSRTIAKTEEEQRLVTEQMFREGPLKPGEPDYHIVDYYDVRCGDRVTSLVMDMYHCAQPEPSQAPPGFTIE